MKAQLKRCQRQNAIDIQSPVHPRTQLGHLVVMLSRLPWSGVLGIPVMSYVAVNVSRCRWNTVFTDFSTFSICELVWHFSLKCRCHSRSSYSMRFFWFIEPSNPAINDEKNPLAVMSFEGLGQLLNVTFPLDSHTADHFLHDIKLVLA